jgi:CheY-like chemotaxis protein
VNTVDNTAPGSEPARAEGTGSRDRRKLVLLVEDNRADRDIYGGLLWYNGYDVIHVATGEEAVAKVLDVRPDLVLLDIRLPGGLSGLDVARHLRGEGLDMPIIVLSAVPRDELGTAAAEVGIRTYLEKPIDPFSVVRVVMKGIGTAQGDR